MAKTVTTRTIHAAPGSVASNDFNLFQTWLKAQLTAYALRLLPANPSIGQSVTWNGSEWVAAFTGGVGTGLDAALPSPVNPFVRLYIAFDTGRIYAYNGSTLAWVVILGPANNP